MIAPTTPEAPAAELATAQPELSSSDYELLFMLTPHVGAALDNYIRFGAISAAGVCESVAGWMAASGKWAGREAALLVKLCAASPRRPRGCAAALRVYGFNRIADEIMRRAAGA